MNEAYGTRRSVLWHFPELPSMEHCRLREGAAGVSLQGELVALRDGDPASVRYRVDCSSNWVTESCEVTVTLPSEVIEVDLVRNPSGRWTRAGRPVPELDGCADVDLGFSPCTNTLPIRRLELRVGDRKRVIAAWLRFPELDLVRSEQVYTRMVDNQYRYESADGSFSAELDVDEWGIVTRYGHFWREITPDRAAPRSKPSQPDGPSTV